jgi:orotate phosphoribosyltransferase
MNERRRVYDTFQQTHDPLMVLRALNGYYECPVSASGKRLGPLVGYAGKDGQGRQFVGEVYANFGEMEQWPYIMHTFGKELIKNNEVLHSIDCLCGAPLGGMTFGTVVADLLACRYIFPEKVVTAVATEGQREQTTLKFARHKIVSGENVVIAEDVINNVSTAEMMIKMFLDASATVKALVCLLNRSLTVDAVYHSQVAGCDIPVIAVVRKPIQQWQQDDPAVAEDVTNGNVVWKPKNEWDHLMVAMG